MALIGKTEKLVEHQGIFGTILFLLQNAYFIKKAFWRW